MLLAAVKFNQISAVLGIVSSNSRCGRHDKIVRALLFALVVGTFGSDSAVVAQDNRDPILSECDRVWPLVEPYGDLTREKPSMETQKEAFGVCSRAYKQDPNSASLKFRYAHLLLATAHESTEPIGKEAIIETLNLIRVAAEAGNPSAEISMAMMPQKYFALARNEHDNRYWLMRAADHGNPRAMVVMAQEYWKKKRDKSDAAMAKAVDWATKALMKIQHADSRAIMFTILVDGSTSRKQIAGYLKKLEVLSSQGSVSSGNALNAIYLIGMFLPDNLKLEFMTFENSMRHIEAIANKGDPLSRSIAKEFMGKRFNNTLILMAYVCSSPHRRRSKYYRSVLKNCPMGGR
jgi:hypothetical protein